MRGSEAASNQHRTLGVALQPVSAASGVTDASGEGGKEAGPTEDENLPDWKAMGKHVHGVFKYGTKA